MVSRRDRSHESLPKPPPATTAEAREKQMVSLAFDQAELQLREGTAPAPVLVHFLKLGTERDKLERAELEYKSKLLEKKIKDIDTAQNMEALQKEAIRAMTEYKGQAGDDDEDDY